MAAFKNQDRLSFCLTPSVAPLSSDNPNGFHHSLREQRGLQVETVFVSWMSTFTDRLAQQEILRNLVAIWKHCFDYTLLTSTWNHCCPTVFLLAISHQTFRVHFILCVYAVPWDEDMFPQGRKDLIHLCCCSGNNEQVNDSTSVSVLYKAKTMSSPYSFVEYKMCFSSAQEILIVITWGVILQVTIIAQSKPNTWPEKK